MRLEAEAATTAAAAAAAKKNNLFKCISLAVKFGVLEKRKGSTDLFNKRYGFEVTKTKEKKKKKLQSKGLFALRTHYVL